MAGRIGPTEGTEIMAGLAHQCRIVEASELRARLETLEQHVEKIHPKD